MTMKNLRNRVDVKLVDDKKDYLKQTSKPGYMSQKIFDNNLVAIHKSKFALTLNKPVYVGVHILELRKVLMYEFHYDYIKNKYCIKSRLLLTDSDSLMYEIRTDDTYEDFSNNKEIFDFINYSTKSQYYDDSKKLVVGKMKDEIGGDAIELFVQLKPLVDSLYSFYLLYLLYSLLVDENTKHKKAKSVNKNVVATINHNEYKDVLLNKKFLRHSMNRIQSKDHRIGTYKINKTSLPCFNDNIYIQKQLI